jgi:hypothetical protein
MNKNNPFLSPHMLQGQVKVAEVGLPPSPVSVLAPVPAMVDRVWVERESILICLWPASAMNRLPMLSPQIPAGVFNTPPVVPVRVEMMPVDLTT